MVDKNYVLRTVDSWIFNKYGNHILTNEGKADINNIAELVNKADNIKTEVIDVDKEDIVVDMNTDGEGNDISFSWDEEKLMIYVPKELRERIQLEVEYVLSGFDKVQIAVAELSKEFQITREGAIVNAEKEIANIENDPSNDSRQVIVGCINDVGSAIEQIKKSIIHVCEEIERIPKDRKRRLFATPIKKRLEDVRNARVYVYDYVYGTAVYAELNLKIGREKAAKDRMRQTVDFLNEMKTNGRFERVEQWNEKKDLFWKKEIDAQISLLEKQLSDIQNYSGRITL